tara:strand:- start:20013 stop:20945 length:933 start_codon:yes stop_codon:yes gene_type:complete
MKDLIQSLPVLQREKDTKLITNLSVFLRKIRNENTKAATEKALKEFYTFKPCSDLLKDLNETRCLDYLDYLESKNRSTSTINQRFSLINKFVLFLRKRDLIDHNPTEVIERPGIITSRPTKALTAEEVKKLLRACPKDSVSNLSFFMALNLQLRIGCRVGELKKLKWSSLTDNILVFQQKGGKERIVSLPEEMAEQIMEYKEELETMMETKLSKDDYIFQMRFDRKFGKQDKPFDTSAFNRKLKKLGEQLGIKKNLHSHQSRATFFTEGLDIGFSARDMAGMAGCTITNVERYDAGNLEKQKDIIRKQRY